MLTVIHKTKVPAGGQFVYVDPDSGLRIEHPFFAQLMENARKHREVNNFPIGLEWRHQFETNVCQNTPVPGLCVDIELPSMLARAGHLMKAVSDFALSGFKTCTYEQVAERQSICEGCPHWGGAAGGLVFIACGKCGCTRIKLALATEKCPKDKWPVL